MGQFVLVFNNQIHYQIGNPHAFSRTLQVNTTLLWVLEYYREKYVHM